MLPGAILDESDGSVVSIKDQLLNGGKRLVLAKVASVGDSLDLKNELRFFVRDVPICESGVEHLNFHLVEVVLKPLFDFI